MMETLERLPVIGRKKRKTRAFAVHAHCHNVLSVGTIDLIHSRKNDAHAVKSAWPDLPSERLLTVSGSES